jgi:type III secretion protein F
MSVELAVSSLMNKLGAYSQNFQGQIEEATQNITREDGSIDQEALLKVQFQMGQYNALMELTSSIGKSVTDMLKTLAQRTS